MVRDKNKGKPNHTSSPAIVSKSKNKSTMPMTNSSSVKQIEEGDSVVAIKPPYKRNFY